LSLCGGVLAHKIRPMEQNRRPGYFRPTVGISRADLTRDCIQQLRMWPGCEAVEGIAVLATAGGKFTVHVVDYGSAKKHLSDRAVRCIQREQQRRYHLKPD